MNASASFPRFGPKALLIALLLLPGSLLFAGEGHGHEKLKQIASFEANFSKSQSEYESIEACMKAHQVPGLSIAVLRDGKLAWAKGYGLISANGSQPIDTETVFSVGSISKLVTAVISLRLVQQGRLQLDEDVNRYMKRWQVPATSFTERQTVSLRHIMSHTAGFTIHGFGDFQPGAALPTLLDTLNGKAPAMHGPVIVNFEPGSKYRYSGGGTTVQQLIIEEVSGKPFTEAAKHFVLAPLNMKRSTFQNPLSASHGNIAKAHNAQGQPTALPRGWEAMPEMAASGLWTTASDLAHLFAALIQTHRGSDSSFLKPALVHDMMRKVPPGNHGLGPQIYGKQLFGHGGSNNSYRALTRAHLGSGNGIIALTNGTNGRKVAQAMIEAMAHMEGW